MLKRKVFVELFLYIRIENIYVSVEGESEKQMVWGF